MASLLKNTAIFTAFLFFQRIASFVLMPLYTRYLSPEEYGKIAVTMSLSSVLGIFYLLSLNAPTIRFYYDAPNDLNFIAKLWGQVLVILGLNILMLSSILYIGRNWLLTPVMDEVPIWPFALFAVLISVTSSVYNLYQAFLQAQQKARSFATNNVLFFLVSTGSAIIMVVGFDLGAIGVLSATLLANVIFAIFALYRIIPRSSFSFDKAMTKNILTYSLPLVPHAISGWITGTMDRLFLVKYLDMAKVGIYNIAYQVSFFILAFSSSVNQAFVPWFYEQMRRGDEASMRKVSLVTEVGVFFYAGVGFIVSYWIEEILFFLVASPFHSAATFVPLLVSSAVFGGAYFFLCAPIFYTKSATKKMPFLTFGGSMVNVIGNLVLIKYWGALGAAVTSLLGNAVITLLVANYSRKLVTIPYRFFVMLGWICFFGALAHIKYVNSWFGFAFIGKTVLFVFLMWSILLFQRSQFKEVWQILETKIPLFKRMKAKCNSSEFRV